MLDPPSRKIAPILFSFIRRCAFCTRAVRSSRVIGAMPAVIGLSAAMAGWGPLVAGVADCACAVSGAVLQLATPRPSPAAALECRNERRLVFMGDPDTDVNHRGHRGDRAYLSKCILAFTKK